MSKSLNIAHYPKWYFEISEQVASGREVRTEAMLPSLAKNLVMDFTSGFKRAVRQSGQVANDIVRRQVETVHIRYEKESANEWRVVFHHPDDTRMAQIVQRALEQLPPLTPREPSPSRREEPDTPRASPGASPETASNPFNFPTFDADPTEDILARRLRHSRCSLCTPDLECHEPGVPCIRASRTET